eukprot:scaffold8214_cov121-Isochrysis_galbana.AAC.2
MGWPSRSEPATIAKRGWSVPSSITRLVPNICSDRSHMTSPTTIPRMELSNSQLATSALGMSGGSAVRYIAAITSRKRLEPQVHLTRFSATAEPVHVS